MLNARDTEGVKAAWTASGLNVRLAAEIVQIICEYVPWSSQSILPCDELQFILMDEWCDPGGSIALLVIADKYKTTVPADCVIVADIVGHVSTVTGTE
jgi:hypothetical protein